MWSDSIVLMITKYFAWQQFRVVSDSTDLGQNHPKSGINVRAHFAFCAIRITIEQRAHDGLVPSKRGLGFLIAIKLRNPKVKVIGSILPNHVEQTLILSCGNNRVMKAVIDIDKMLAG